MIKSFTTGFEKTGIASGRDLAVHPDDEKWSKVPPASGGTTGYKPTCLADSLNQAAQELIQRKLRDQSHSFSENGYVVRAIPEYSDETFLDQVVELAYEMSGAGGQHSQIAQVFSKFDRFNRSMVAPNQVFSGFTFFTRPRLCLADWNICADRKFSALITKDINSMPFAIRAYLDTKWANEADTGSCPLFDRGNPFLVPFSNRLRSISGFNDPMLVTETTEGGFFSEDQTYVIGGDRMARTYDINCLFHDIPGNPILSMVDYWCQYMANLQDGSMQQYSDAIDCNRMDYTVSIYRFLMDRTNRFIVRWCKCTGCYPVSPPSGVVFNLNEGEQMVQSASQLNVPFKANRIEYDDPVILKEFNMLVRRYAKIGPSPFYSSTSDNMKSETSNASNNTGQDTSDRRKLMAVHAFAPLPQNNFSGIPYIRPYNRNGYELVWLARNVLGEYLIDVQKDKDGYIHDASDADDRYNIL